jgi:hypothetical protein
MIAVAIRLLCGHRDRLPRRRPVTVYVHEGPWPIPPGWTERPPHSTFELVCQYCGFAPRPGDEGMRTLIEMAAAAGGKLDINPAR